MRPLCLPTLAALCAPLICCATALAQPQREAPAEVRQAVVIEVQTHRGDLLMPPIFLQYGETQPSESEFEFINKDTPSKSAFLFHIRRGSKGFTMLWHFRSLIPGSAHFKLQAPELSPLGLKMAFAYQLKARLGSDDQHAAFLESTPAPTARVEAHRSALVDKNHEAILGAEGVWSSPGWPDIPSQPALIPLDGSRVVLAHEGDLLIYARHFKKIDAAAPSP